MGEDHLVDCCLWPNTIPGKHDKIDITQQSFCNHSPIRPVGVLGGLGTMPGFEVIKLFSTAHKC